MNVPNKDTKIGKMYNEVGKVITEDKVKANIFHTFFANIGRTYAEKVLKPKANVSKPTLNMNSFFVTPVSDKEILDIIQSLKSRKEKGGFDGIRVEELKQTATEIR